MYRAGRQWQTVDAACCSLLLLGLRENGDDEDRPPAAAGQREAVLVTAAMAQRRKHARDAGGGGGWLAGSALFSRDIFVAAVCVATGHRSPGTLACGLWSQLRSDRIRTDITDIIFVFIFLSGFGFEYG